MIGEFDRVLGGGVVPGSVVLLGGDPGIGKSTLLLQVCARISEVSGSVLYVSGEESTSQIKLRAQRLGLGTQALYLSCETILEVIKEQAASLKPQVLVIDSIQTTYTPRLTSTPGSLAQVRQVTHELLTLAKREGISCFLVGHVTKDGAIAGPRALEHMVDTVLYLEGERYYSYRILRAAKNRFGATSEIGVFEMRGTGLEEILNPSEVFLAERSPGNSGSAVVATLEGTRPLLVELQALVAQDISNIPRRHATGLDLNRFMLLLAVIKNRLGLHLHNLDVFINVAGGIRLDEPAADLGLLLAVVSSFRREPIPQDLVAIGEIGLGGEIRGVTQIEARLKEAAKLGFSRCLLPKSNLNKLDATELNASLTLELLGVRQAGEALEVVFG